MASYTISPVWGAGAQLFDNSGNVLTGGKIYTYEAGTTTPATTYTNPIGTVANTNPIIANAAGRLTNEIWFPVSGAYKFVLKDANDVLLATYDNIPTTPQPPIVNDASSISYEQGYEVTAGNFTIGATYLITSVGTTNFVAIGAAANVTGIHFTATGVGSGTGTAEYSRTVQDKLRDTVSVKDFGAVGDGVTDDTVAIQAALDSVFNGPNSYAPTKTSGGAGRVYLFFPNGDYRVTSTLDCSQRDYTQLIGEGRATIYSESTEYIIDMSSTDHCVMQNLALYSTTARVGIYIDRCTTAPYVQFNVYDTVTVTLTSNVLANSGQGRIGIWNGRGELNVFSNVEVRADLPMYATRNADLNFSPTNGTLDTTIVSSVQNTYNACKWISRTVHSSCIVLNGCISHEFYGNYWASENTSSGFSPYAITNVGAINCKFTGTVETLPSFMLVKGFITYDNDIDLSFQNHFDGRGIIQCEDATAAVGFCSGKVNISTSGVIPSGTCVIKGSIASLSNTINGNAITALSTLPPVITNGENAGRIIQTEAGVTVIANNVTTNIVQSPLSSVIASVPNATPTTLFTAAQYGTYKVVAYIYNAGVNFIATATIVNDGTNTMLLEYTPSAFLTLSISGANVQVTQSSGAPASVVCQVLAY